MRILPLTLFVCFFTASAASAAPSLGRVDSGVLTELENGEVLRSVVAGTPNHGEALGKIEGTVAEVAATLMDWNTFDQWSPSAYDVRVVGEEGAQTRVAGATELPWPISDRTWHIMTRAESLTVDGQECWSMSWTYVAGSGNLEDTSGYWLACPWPHDASASIVRYVVDADAGIPIPNSVINWATNRTLPTLFERLNEQVQRRR
ncbi:MAG: hypothetical protein ACI81R_000015 [Bradymonadia bacterium]|jgi:hypothetical protein